VKEHELENLRRSLAMLSPGQPALSREQALAIVADVAEAQNELRRLRLDLQRLIESIES
jgi:hypothetical protein